MMKLRNWLLIALVVLTPGCGMTQMFNTDPGYDYKKQPDGSAILLDTPRMWRDFAAGVNTMVTGEAQGKHPYTNPQSSLYSTSWNDYWLKRIHWLESGKQENPQKYVDYIIDQRRALGLPELTGYP